MQRRIKKHVRFLKCESSGNDTNLTTSGISVEVIQSRLNEDMEKVHRWLLANKLTLNIKKNRIYADRLLTTFKRYPNRS